MMRSRAYQSLAAALALFAAASHVRAGDGQIDLKLNPASTNTISASGSYILVDGVVGTVNPILTISATDVTLDLNGQTIEGSAITGINVTNARVRIKNGKLRGLSTGISGGSTQSTIVEDVQVFSGTAGTGITLGTDAIVRNCSAAGGATGIQVGNNSVVIGCTTNGNSTSSSSGAGIKAGNHCQVTGNTANGNNGAGGGNGVGIEVGTDCLVANNTANSNLDSSTGTATGAGILVGNGSTVVNNVCNGNGRAGALGSGIGIGPTIATGILDNAVIRGNTVIGTIGQGGSPRSSIGIYVSSGCRVEYNSSINNTISGGSTLGYGIYVDNQDNYIFQNFTRLNSHAGIFNNSGSAVNRFEQNHMTDTTGLVIGGGNGGTPDAAGNVTY